MPKVNGYDHSKAEKKWRDRWENEKLYQPSLKEAKKPFYNLMMYPYPSAEGLHVGNMYAFTGADIYGRLKRMQGNDVFEPIGLDGFGIHSENYAIKAGKHPQEHAKESEKNFYRQLSQIGNGFAWDNKLETYDPEYYKWTQWIFTKMFKEGLAYKDEATVNWCPSCKTVLADEQVESGFCERCGTEVERRKMSSWFFRITDYADRLLENIEEIDWPEKIKIAQRQWIGKKEGAKVTFDLKVEGQPDKHSVDVFTTRLDTIYGATFLVVAPELAQQWLDVGWQAPDNVSKYIKESLGKTEQQRKEEAGTKKGINAQIKAVNPANGDELPVFVADYVMMDVGTGAVMGVPAHDQRDFEFAKECDLEVKRVVSEKKAEGGKLKEAYGGEGFLVNSGEYDTMPSAKARKKMIADFSFAQRQVTYHLRDWLISRQRYWGPPIPMIHCEVCEKKGKGERDDLPGWYSVSEKDLPIKLPEIKDFKPKGKGHTPLSNAPDSWKKVECPHCGNEAERELEVSDTFLDSSWYFLGYPHMRGGEWVGDPFDNEILKKWLPVNAYIGGAEHAVLHLLYARFVTMALHDMGYLDFEEPFPFLFTHGLLISEGAKMSKSRGNVVVPDTYIEKFGADTLRSYLMFLGPYDKGGDFRDTGIEGMDRFLKRVWRLYENKDIALVEEGIADEILIKMHQTIKKVTKDIERLSYNTALARIMEYVNLLRDVAEGEGVKAVGEKNVRCAEWDDGLRVLALLLAPFAPHMMEEIWVEVLSQRFSIHASAWPKFNPELTREEEVVVSIQVNGKLRGTVRMDRDDASYKETVVVEAKKDEKVAKWLENVEDTIFVPGKVINFVTK